MSEENNDIVKAVLADVGIVAGKVSDFIYPLAAKPRDYANICYHKQHIIDVHNRVITCATCGAPLDPIKCIGEYADNPEWIRRARKERDSMTKEIDELRRELLKLRAAKRRLKP